jgi:hypothetical protein
VLRASPVSRTHFRRTLEREKKAGKAAAAP